MLIEGGLVLVSGPGAEILSAAELRAHCRVDHADDDAYLAALAAAARLRIEKETGLCLLTCSWRQTHDGFPGSAGPIELFRSPLQSVSSVSYLDPDGNLVAMDAADWQAPEGRAVPFVQPAASWPSTDGSAGCVRIAYSAGYGALASDVPEPIRQAARLLAGHWHAHRESVADGAPPKEMPLAAEWLLDPYRSGRYA